jgi:hypothetical protein
MQPSNTRIERTIGAGILVRERWRVAPLAAHPPCWKVASLSGGSTAQRMGRDPNLAVLPRRRRAAISRSWGDVGGFVTLNRKQGGSSPCGVHRVAGNRALLVSSEVAGNRRRQERRSVVGAKGVAPLKGRDVVGVVVNPTRSIVRVCGRVPSNTRIERTIGVGILVKERQRLTPLAAQPPC